MSTQFPKRGAHSKVARGNANGIPGNALEDTSGAGLTEVHLRDFFAIVWDAGFSACYAWFESRRRAPMNAEVPAPPNPLKNDKRNVDYDDIAMSNFSLIVSDKLARKRMEYPNRDWLKATPADLSRMLREHVDKGDPIDVAAFCMFLHQRGYRIEPCPKTH